MSRRRFLALCGGSISGIWLAGTGLVRLPAEMVLALSGACSFCLRKPDHLFGLAGVVGRSARVCDGCLELCLDILAEEHGTEPPAPAPPELVATFPPGVLDDPERVASLLRRLGGGEIDDTLIETVARALTRPDEPPPAPAPSGEDRICSFCDRDEHDAAALIAGPSVYICDGCVGDAAALFMRHGWEPGV